MDFYRETIKNVPPMIRVPQELRNRDVEVIILPLEKGEVDAVSVEVDANGYPIGFFERTAGSLADDPIVRAHQGEFEEREEII